MFIVIHYSDIGTKGGNRAFFEKKLMENIRQLIKGNIKVYRRYGRIVLKLDKGSYPSTILDKLMFIPGISSYAVAERASLGVKEIKEKTEKLLEKEIFKSFRITARRSNKKFPLRSQEINIELGDFVRQKFQKKVQLKKPDLNIFIDIGEKEVFVYLRKYPGIGGLPVGSSGKVVALLSGGIDSPVAAYLAARKGLKVVLCHILNKTMSGGRAGTQKLNKIARELSKVQGETKLYIAPFEAIQKAIIASIPAESRMIVYRRFMMRIAEKIATKEKAKGLVTGDSVGQVASQTLDNLACIYEGVSLPILTPLIGMSKEEIIEIAKKIGTYELSIIPYPDCCSFMIAKHPETRGKIEIIKKIERLISSKDRLIKDSIEKAETMVVD